LPTFGRPTMATVKGMAERSRDPLFQTMEHTGCNTRKQHPTG
jgi:hypothetical protein